MHLVDQIKAKARTSLQTVVLPESYDDRMIQAAELITGDNLAQVVLLGDPATLEAKAGELGVSLKGVELIDPQSAAKLDDYVAELVKLRYFVGMSTEEAAECLGIHRATAHRHWAYARAWIRADVRSSDTSHK